MPDPVAHRQFKDASGHLWDVWEVRPETSAEPYLREGWLCFENQKAERMRFAPVPHGWENLTDEVLRFVLSVAAPAPKRKV